MLFYRKTWERESSNSRTPAAAFPSSLLFILGLKSEEEWGVGASKIAPQKDNSETGGNIPHAWEFDQAACFSSFQRGEKLEAQLRKAILKSASTILFCQFRLSIVYIDIVVWKHQ